MSESIDRRNFLATAAAAGLGLTMLGSARRSNAAERGPAPEKPFQCKPLEKVRVGFIGVGGQGSSHVRNYTRIDNVEIKAICDLVPEKVAKNQDAIVKAGKPKPQGYSNGPKDYLNLVARDDLDLVFIATPWELHVPMMVAAMNAGKHAATEVPMAVTVDECWELVDTAEKTQRHCLMMENCCYGRFEMMVLNMVRKGVLGELLHAEGGYLHDLRGVKFGTVGEGEWRRAHATKRNGNLYPTHGLAPLAQCMNINRGDAFDYLVSMSGKTRGLAKYAAEHLPKNDPRLQEKYVLGDVNYTLIKTKNGCTIVVGHNCDSPRPYSRITTLQGTQGIVSGYPDRVYIEGRDKGDAWVDAEKYYPEFEHPLWKARGANAKGAGHGGMDFLEDWRLVQCLLKGEPTDMNVYDGVAWSVVSALSEWSVANGSKPIDFPDFTRGRWKTFAPLGIVQG